MEFVLIEAGRLKAHSLGSVPVLPVISAGLINAAGDRGQKIKRAAAAAPRVTRCRFTRKLQQ
jgi:hypothetical protein